MVKSLFQFSATRNVQCNESPQWESRAPAAAPQRTEEQGKGTTTQRQTQECTQQPERTKKSEFKNALKNSWGS